MKTKDRLPLWKREFMERFERFVEAEQKEDGLDVDECRMFIDSWLREAAMIWKMDSR